MAASKRQGDGDNEVDDNILGDGVYEKPTSAVCFFQHDDDSPIGTGFAVSTDTIFNAAHNFPNPTAGNQVLCHFGKQHQQVTRRLEISHVNENLDYCILTICDGEPDLPGHLVVAGTTLKVGKTCILAAFQIGIQQDLKDLDPELSVGIFKGEIAKLYPRHFVYQCPTFADDSGGAIVLRNGMVVGIHQETVNQAGERLAQAEFRDSSSRSDSIEESLEQLTMSFSSGSVGLRISAIKETSSNTKHKRRISEEP